MYSLHFLFFPPLHSIIFSEFATEITRISAAYYKWQLVQYSCRAVAHPDILGKLQLITEQYLSLGCKCVLWNNANEIILNSKTRDNSERCWKGAGCVLSRRCPCRRLRYAEWWEESSSRAGPQPLQRCEYIKEDVFYSFTIVKVANAGILITFFTCLFS
jgi:hypothetical protein